MTRADAGGSALMARPSAEDLAVFESHRALLAGLAYRMLGDLGRAEESLDQVSMAYAGNGRWSLEEDFWAVPRAYETVEIYAAACKDPEHRNKRTRRHWGKGPGWTHGGASWAERPSVR
jgi:hypothetical protein